MIPRDRAARPLRGLGIPDPRREVVASAVRGLNRRARVAIAGSAAPRRRAVWIE
jgi:hypothetical protein